MKEKEKKEQVGKYVLPLNQESEMQTHAYHCGQEALPALG